MILRHHSSPTCIYSRFFSSSSPSKPLLLRAVTLTAKLTSVNSPSKTLSLNSANLTAKLTSVNSRSFSSSPSKAAPLSSDYLTADLTAVNSRSFSSLHSGRLSSVSSRLFYLPSKVDPVSSGDLTAVNSRLFSSLPSKTVPIRSGDLTAVNLPLKVDPLRSGGGTSGLAAEDLILDDDEFASVTAVKTSTLPTLLQPRVVVYDGVCHLCHRGVKLVIKADKDRKIKFCCLQSKAAELYMRICGVDREDVLRRFLFIEGPEEYHQGSTAALKVLSYLPLPYSALSTLMIVPTPIRDAAYDYIAKRRYDWFGKDTNCLVLKEKELLDRFIDRDEMIHKKWSEE